MRGEEIKLETGCRSGPFSLRYLQRNQKIRQEIGGVAKSENQE